ncbi:hypothetical protein COOONC_00328 [Cooperia oncophora]
MDDEPPKAHFFFAESDEDSLDIADHKSDIPNNVPDPSTNCDVPPVLTDGASIDSAEFTRAADGKAPIEGHHEAKLSEANVREGMSRVIRTGGGLRENEMPLTRIELVHAVKIT